MICHCYIYRAGTAWSNYCRQGGSHHTVKEEISVTDRIGGSIEKLSLKLTLTFRALQTTQP